MNDFVANILDSREGGNDEWSGRLVPVPVFALVAKVGEP